MYISGMMGLGDNVYQRAFISAIKFPVYIETPWPELYEGTLAKPVHCPAYNAAKQIGHRTGAKFTGKAQGDGTVRIWRTA